MTRWSLFDNLAQDLRFTIRQLAKNPGFTATAVTVLALGICSSLAIFAFVDAALLQPLPYRDTSRLVGVYERIPRCQLCNLSYFDYLDWKKLNKAFSSLEAYRQSGFILSTPSGSLPTRGIRVSAGFFRVLGVSVALGRDFLDGEDLPGAARTVVLSNETWKSRYGARRDLIGQSILLDDLPHTVIGVLPAGFHFAPAGTPEFWTALDPSNSCEQRRGCHNLYGVARLKDGVSVEAALADTQLIARQLEAQYPDSNRGQGANVVPLAEVIVGNVRPILYVLMAGAALLLLIASVNVASLLLVRSESRRREMAVRRALGASNARLTGQFVTEGIVLVSIAAVLGLAAAFWATQLLARLVPADMLLRMPFLSNLRFNTHAALFAAGVALFAAVLVCLTPVLRVSFGGMEGALAEGSRGSAGVTWRRIGSKLVALELATAMVLLVGAGLLGQSLYRLLRVDLGFQPDHLATIAVGAPNKTYGKDEQAIALERKIFDRVRSLPGVINVAAATTMPVSFNGNTTWIRIVGHPFHGEHNEVNERDVSAGFFQTIGARLLRGRYFTDSEDASKPGVVIINEALAKKYFAGEDPLGQKIGNNTLAPRSIREIIGVVADIREGALDSEIWPAVYEPFNQSPDDYFSLIARTAQNEQSMVPQLAKVIHDIDPAIVTRQPIGMQARIANSQSAYMHRSTAWLVGVFAAMALALGLVGLYGVIAYSVSQRTREIGVRMALGADRRNVCTLILSEAGWLTLIGIVAGALGSLAASTLMRKLLFGVQSWDLPTLAAVAIVLAGSALVASFIPARRAASVNPVDALRAE